MLIGSWWRLEWYIMHSRIISQISPTFGKIPRKFPEKFGNLVQISGIQSKFREFSQDFGNLNWIFQWILRTFQWFEHYSKTLKYYWILQFTEILWNFSDSHWNSQPRWEIHPKLYLNYHITISRKINLNLGRREHGGKWVGMGGWRVRCRKFTGKFPREIIGICGNFRKTDRIGFTEV